PDDEAVLAARVRPVDRQLAAGVRHLLLGVRRWTGADLRARSTDPADRHDPRALPERARDHSGGAGNRLDEDALPVRQPVPAASTATSGRRGRRTAHMVRAGVAGADTARRRKRTGPGAHGVPALPASSRKNF